MIGLKKKICHHNFHDILPWELHAYRVSCTNWASTTEMHGEINRLVCLGILYTLWPEDTWFTQCVLDWSVIRCCLKCIIEGIYTGSPICKNATMCKCPLTFLLLIWSSCFIWPTFAGARLFDAFYNVPSHLYITCNWLRMNGMHEINSESECSNFLQHTLDEIKHPGLHVWRFQTGKSGKDRVKYHI